MNRTIHASCIVLGAAGKYFGSSNTGVLLLGKSGAGKSDLTLRFLAMGAALVSDDRTELFVRRGGLYARAPKAIAGYLEIRGLGIVEFRHRPSARIGLVVDLDKKPERLPDHKAFTPRLALGLAAVQRPPLIRVNAFEPSAPAKIAAAAAAFSRKLFRDQAKPG
jgi:serine kinase of HPr protein (carbohydrate metabolism regulator)